MLELYHNNISVCAQKVRIVLAEKNVPWTNHHMSLAKGEQLTPEFKHEVALKRLEYYGRLGALNAAAVEMEKTLPNKVAPISRQKVADMLVRLREELRFTVISLNRVAKSVKDL